MRPVLIGTLLLCLAIPLSAQTELDAASGDAAAILAGGLEENAGFRVAVGDLNGDSRPDLAIGVPGSAGPTGDRYAAGAVFVFFNTASLSGVLDPMTAASFTLWGAVGDPDGTPPYEGDELGRGLLIADLNGDDVNELIVGAPRASGPGARSQSGVIVVLRGPLSSGSLDLSVSAPTWMIEGEDPFDNIGTSLAVGDTDLLPGNEMLIGIPEADGEANAKQSSGEALLLAWNPAPPANLDLATVDPIAHFRGDATGDQLGAAVVLADILGADGAADLILGAPGADGPGDTRENAGGAFVLDAAFLPPFTVDLSDGIADLTIYGARAGDSAGGSLVAADWNVDSVPDIAIGAPGGDGPGPSFNRSDAGQTHVVFVGSSMPFEMDLLTEPVQTRIFGEESGHFFSTSLAAGEVECSAGDALVSGAPFSDGPDGTRRNAGSVYLLTPEPGQPQFVDLATRRAAVQLHGAGVDARAGFSSALGFLGGGPNTDLVVGAPLSSVNGGALGGEVYLVHDICGSNPPVAYARIPAVVGCVSGGVATVPLDGSSSTDRDSTPGTNDDIVEFNWYEPDINGTLIAQGEVTSADLPVGTTTIELEVVDSSGQSDTMIVQVTIEDAPSEATDFRISRNSAAPDDVAFDYTDASCATSSRIFRGTLAGLSGGYDHSVPFSGAAGDPECAASPGLVIPGESASSGGQLTGWYYLVASVNAPAGNNVIGGLGGADLDGDGIAESPRPRPGQAPGVVDNCP